MANILISFIYIKSQNVTLINEFVSMESKVNNMYTLIFSNLILLRATTMKAERNTLL